MKKISALPLLFFSLQILAQSKENEHFALGFFMGLEAQSLGVQPLDSREPDGAAVRSGRLGIGSSVGILGRKLLRKGLYFQPELSLSYTSNNLYFRKEGRSEVPFLDAEIPLHLVLTNWRRSDFPLQGCMIFGGRFGWNFANKPSNLLTITPERLGLDIGLGAEIRIKRWRLQPAFVYSHGLNNLHQIRQAAYDAVVGKVVRDKLSFRLSVCIIGK